MKTFTFTNGPTIEFDETAPCIVCGNPVIDLSMGGPDICPSCDCGYDRNGKKLDSIYLVKYLYHLKPWVPSFDFVERVYTALSAHGLHVDYWELVCRIHLGDKT